LKRCASNVSDTDLSNQCNSSSDSDTSHSDWHFLVQVFLIYVLKTQDNVTATIIILYSMWLTPF
jgi:hypothetical protein